MSERGVGVLWLLAGLVLASIAAWIFSPWPRALLIRYLFEKGGARLAKALEKHVPADVAAQRDLAYRDNDVDARLDVFRPASAEAAGTALPTIVWIHGGGWLSGSKRDVDPYLRILASHGYTAVGIDYSLAPGKRYPTPVKQANDAFRYLLANAARLGVDPDGIFIAGDSAGAQIAAQIGLITTSPRYADAVGMVPALQATQLRALLLFCGAFDMTQPTYKGVNGTLMHALLWAYSGQRDFSGMAAFQLASPMPHIDDRFPPSYITAGNGDPIEPLSRALAARLQQLGVETDTLFYPADYAPAPPHEYQYNLDSAEGQQSLARTLAFLKRHTTGQPND